jgi:hypothetical protein
MGGKILRSKTNRPLSVLFWRFGYKNRNMDQNEDIFLVEKPIVFHQICF